jgi:hypothetical protein
MDLPTSNLFKFSIGILLTAIHVQVVAVSAIAQPNPILTRQKTCPLVKSIYRAIGNPEFELVFGPSQSKIATEVAAFTLKHKARGNIVAYNLGGSMGYGGLYLTAVKQKTNRDSAEKLKPYFFDSKWNNINGITNPVPQYFFISGLGVEDWYSNRPGNRTQPLGDVMWQFERCQAQ